VDNKLFLNKSLRACVIIDGDNMDNETIEKAKRGNKEAQKQIYIEYKDKIYTFCFFRLNNHDDAEDLTQDIFLKVFKGIRTFKSGNFNAWIYRIAINHILNTMIRRNNFMELRENITVVKQKDIVDTVDIERALNKLPENLSLLLILREKEGLDYKELSSVFRVPIGTIKSRLVKARELFKKFYGGRNE
jgi:RNA polymerase sigma-70 factor (ECF subfamily)